MDNSQQYLEMCFKAKEIQRLCQDERHNEHCEIWGPYYMVWLPRQDQLQKMVKYSVWFETLYRFYDWLQSKEKIHNWDSQCTKFNSFEQLWLAFVMKEKFNKTWNGVDWIA